LRALGNAVVPQCVTVAGEILAAIEWERENDNETKT
jgi:hypothetical protein